MMKKRLGDSFTVILLGVIFNPNSKKILIGRREKDPFIPKLTWAFPGGRAVSGEELEKTLKRKIKEETGLDTENLGSIFARILQENSEFLLVYYLCEATGGREKPSGDLVELKWVFPKEIEKFFTTSFHPALREYIMNLK